MSPVQQERAAGLLLVALLAAHTALKVRLGILPEMLWLCHLATALSAVGLLVGRPQLAVVGGLTHVAVGLTGWILEILLHGTTVTSTLLHIATPAIGLWMARRRGIPRWLPLGGLALWGFGLVMGRLFDPALNLNLAWRAYDIWPPETPGWIYQSCNLGLLLGLMSLTRVVLNRIWRPQRPVLRVPRGGQGDGGG